MVAFLIWFVPLTLLGVVLLVGSGIRIRTVPPAQRLIAWVQFGGACLILAMTVAIGWVVLDLFSQEGQPLPSLSGWWLAYTVCAVPLMITLIIVSVGYLVQELRQVFADRTTSIDVPPEE
jgi:hypothetical protein